VPRHRGSADADPVAAIRAVRKPWAPLRAVARMALPSRSWWVAMRDPLKERL
jgi:hypothetical protein